MSSSKKNINAICVVLFFALTPSIYESLVKERSSIPRLLIIEETENRSGYPPSQLNAISSTAWRERIDSMSGEWRIIDQDASVTGESEWVIEYFNFPRASLPWMVFSNQNKVYYHLHQY